jgi:outer membrane protein OmpA-like peptidoglycan-associated protein
MQTTILSTMALLALGVAAGCHTPEPTSPVAGLTRPVDPPMPPDLGRGPARVSVDLFAAYQPGDVGLVCKGQDPTFKFDSAKAGPRQYLTMQVLANCMREGPLRDRAIRLIGRTDPRGTEAYNERLGLRRAEQVKRYLVDQGVEPDRVETASLGKDDASPNPRDWRTDRRVDVELAP